jgi:rare lipoprotein A
MRLEDRGRRIEDKGLLVICLLLVILFLLTSCEPTALYTTDRPKPKQQQQTQTQTQTQPSTPGDMDRVPTGKTEYMIASWYGNPFHGRKTASGEVFNMYSYTAAHKTLPFGTRLKLINELNNKEVIVKINDRGPFVKGRDIDISYKTALDLDVVRLGVTKLKVVYLD